VPRELGVHHRLDPKRGCLGPRGDFYAQQRLIAVGGGRTPTAKAPPTKTKALAGLQTVAQPVAQPVGRPSSYPGEVEHGVRIPSEDPLRGGGIVFVDLPGSGGDIHDHEFAVVGSLHLGTDLALVDLAPVPDNLLRSVGAVSHTLYSSFLGDFRLHCRSSGAP
jgi:hypothetical protein